MAIIQRITLLYLLLGVCTLWAPKKTIICKRIYIAFDSSIKRRSNGTSEKPIQQNSLRKAISRYDFEPVMHDLFKIDQTETLEKLKEKIALLQQQHKQ